MAGGLLPSSGGHRFSYRKPPVSDINVTPFVDVMLVLLIVFMVTAPLLTQGVDVSLPEVETSPIVEAAEPLQVSIKANGKLFIETREVTKAQLAARLKAILEARKAKPGENIILIRADKRVPYGKVLETMGELQAAGLFNVGLVTEPPSEK